MPSMMAAGRDGDQTPAVRCEQRSSRTSKGRPVAYRAPETPPPAWATWQPVINSRPVPPADAVTTAESPLAVSARIVWGGDGEEWVDGWAIRWTRDAVLVELRDPRCATVG